MTRHIDIKELPAVKNGLLSLRHAAYCMAYKQIINPDSKPIKGIYGASGPDLATSLLTFDASEIFYVDRRPVELKPLENAIKKWKNPIGLPRKHLNPMLTQKRNDCLWRYADFETLGEKLIPLEMKLLGIDKNSIFTGLNDFWNVEMSFWWAYPGHEATKRTLTFIQADLLKPAKYPEQLNVLLQPDNIDFYYQKAAMRCISSLETYFARIVDSVKDTVLVSPMTDVGFPDDIKPRLKSVMKPRFASMPDVNRAYSRFFKSANANDELLGKYPWYLELWKKTEI